MFWTVVRLLLVAMLLMPMLASRKKIPGAVRKTGTKETNISVFVWLLVSVIHLSL